MNAMLADSVRVEVPGAAMKAAIVRGINPDRFTEVWAANPYPRLRWRKAESDRERQEVMDDLVERSRAGATPVKRSIFGGIKLEAVRGETSSFAEMGWQCGEEGKDLCDSCFAWWSKLAK